MVDRRPDATRGRVPGGESEMASWYRIESKAGLVMGMYEGATPAQAVESLNREAGDESSLADWIVTEAPIADDGRLTKGALYHPDSLRLIGWTESDGSGHEGYGAADYFDAGRYLGPDQHGIEPRFELA